MDKDRIKGSAQQAKGKIKEVAGKRPATKNSKAKERPTRSAGKFATPSAA